MDIQLPCLADEGEGLGVRGWLEYAGVLEKRAKVLRSELHCDLRQQMKKQRAGRGVRLTRMMEPATVEGGGAGRVQPSPTHRGRGGMGQSTALL